MKKSESARLRQPIARLNANDHNHNHNLALRVQREPNHKGRKRDVNPDPAVTWQNHVRQNEELTRIWLALKLNFQKRSKRAAT